MIVTAEDMAAVRWQANLYRELKEYWANRAEHLAKELLAAQAKMRAAGVNP